MNEFPIYEQPKELGESRLAIELDSILEQSKGDKEVLFNNLIKHIEGINPADRLEYIEQVNLVHFCDKAGLDKFISRHFANGELLFVNEHGDLETLITDPSSLQTYLQRIKLYTSETQDEAYNFRSQLLASSRGQVHSYSIYTNSDFHIADNDFWNKLADEGQWIKERLKVHAAFLDEGSRAITQLSRELNFAHPTLTLLRGNTGAGKSYFLKNTEPYSRALISSPELAVINPDATKQWLRHKLKEETGHLLRHDQVHFEGSVLSTQLEDVALDNHLSCIIDRRFDNLNFLFSYINRFREQGYDIKIFDIYAPLELSVSRVLLRKYEGDAPVVDYDSILTGYRNINNGLVNLIRTITDDPSGLEYKLYFAADNSIEPVVKFDPQKGTKPQILRPELLQVIYQNISKTRQGLDASNQLLDSELLSLLSKMPGIDSHAISRIARYNNESLRSAVDLKEKALID